MVYLRNLLSISNSVATVCSAAGHKIYYENLKGLCDSVGLVKKKTKPVNIYKSYLYDFHNFFESGSSQMMLIRADPDPQHCLLASCSHVERFFLILHICTYKDDIVMGCGCCKNCRSSELRCNRTEIFMSVKAMAL
jgi:hypothetical protein